MALGGGLHERTRNNFEQLNSSRVINADIERKMDAEFEELENGTYDKDGWQ